MFRLGRDKSSPGGVARETSSPGTPASLEKKISSPGFRVRAKPLTKEEVTTQVSLYWWRKRYENLIVYMRESGVTPEEADDDECIRLLAEWNGIIKDAVNKGREGREWRKANTPVPRSLVLPTLKTGKFVFLGHDKVGRSVCYYRVKLHNPKDFTPEDSVKSVIYLYQELMASANRPDTDEMCVVIDRTDAKSSNMDVEFMKLLYKVVKESFPSRGELFLVTGVNWAFRQIWNNLIAHFLDAKSRSATHLLKDKTELLDYIDEAEIADFCGGKKPYTFEPPKDE